MSCAALRVTVRNRIPLDQQPSALRHKKNTAALVLPCTLVMRCRQVFACAAPTRVQFVLWYHLSKRRISLRCFAGTRVPDKRCRKQVIDGLRWTTIQAIIVGRCHWIHMRPFLRRCPEVLQSWIPLSSFPVHFGDAKHWPCKCAVEVLGLSVAAPRLVSLSLQPPHFPQVEPDQRKIR